MITTIITKRYETGARAADLTIFNYPEENGKMDWNFCDFENGVYNVTMRLWASNKVEIARAINFLFRTETPCKAENIGFYADGTMRFENYSLPRVKC